MSDIAFKMSNENKFTLALTMRLPQQYDLH